MSGTSHIDNEVSNLCGHANTEQKVIYEQHEIISVDMDYTKNMVLTQRGTFYPVHIRHSVVHTRRTNTIDGLSEVYCRCLYGNPL